MYLRQAEVSEVIASLCPPSGWAEQPVEGRSETGWWSQVSHSPLLCLLLSRQEGDFAFWTHECCHTEAQQSQILDYSTSLPSSLSVLGWFGDLSGLTKLI